jgi:hypothetical protein
MGVKPGLSSQWKNIRLRIFEIRVLRKTSGPKREESAEECRRFHNDEHRNLVYSLPDIIRIIGGACSTNGRDEKAHKIWSEDLKVRDHLGNLGVNGRIILKLSFRKEEWWLKSSGSG